MLAPLNQILHEHSPPGAASRALAMVTGSLLGLVFIPVAATVLALALAVVTSRKAGRAVLRWIGSTRDPDVLAQLRADHERQRSADVAR